MGYRKGVVYERELLHLLSGRGFAVIRAPASGSWLTPPDIVALKNGLILAIECKAWRTKPKLNADSQTRLIEWATKAGAIALIAWRTKTGWQFTKAQKPDIWLTLDQLLSVF